MQLQDIGRWASLVVIIASTYILWRVRNLLLLLFLAILIATLLNHAVRLLVRWRLPRPLAVTTVILGAFLGLAVIFVAIVPAFAGQFQELATLVPAGIDNIENWLDDPEQLIPQIFQRNAREIQTWLQQFRNLDFQAIFAQFVAFFSNTLSITLNVLLVIVVSIMLVADPQSYRAAAMRLFPASSRAKAENILDQCEGVISGWFVGISFNMLIIALLSSLGLWIIGVPLPLANGILAGLLTFIPNIGPILSVLPPAAIALIDSPIKALTVVGLYVLIQQVESNILTPLVMRQQVAILPAATLISQVFFAVFFGFLGLLLALPLALVGQIWLEELWIKPVLDAS